MRRHRASPQLVRDRCHVPWTKKAIQAEGIGLRPRPASARQVIHPQEAAGEEDHLAGPKLAPPVVTREALQARIDLTQEVGPRGPLPGDPATPPRRRPAGTRRPSPTQGTGRARRAAASGQKRGSGAGRLPAAGRSPRGGNRHGTPASQLASHGNSRCSGMIRPRWRATRPVQAGFVVAGPVPRVGGSGSRAGSSAPRGRAARGR